MQDSWYIPLSACEWGGAVLEITPCEGVRKRERQVGVSHRRGDGDTNDQMRIEECLID